MDKQFTFRRNFIIMQRQTCLFSLVILLLTAVELSAVFTQWTANQKYAFAGKATVNMQTQIANNGIDWQLPITIRANYPRAMSSLLPYKWLAVIADYGTDYIKSNGIYLFVEASNSSTETYMHIYIKASNASRINKLSISYITLAIHNEVNDNYGIYQVFYSFNNTFKELTNDPSSTYSVFLLIDSFNLLDETKAVMMIGGLDVDTDGITSTIDLQFSIQILSSTNLYLKISSKSAFTTYLAKYFVQIIIYNPNDNYDEVVNYRFFDGIITGTNTYYSYVQNNEKQISAVNTICGLTSFSTSFKESMSFSILFTSENLIQIQAGYSFNFVFTFVSIYSRYCDYKTPYYQSYKDECHTDCPSNFIGDYENLKCLCMNKDGFQVESSLCFSTAQNQTKNSSITTTVSYIEQQNQLAIILGVLLGCTILLFVTGILIYCFCCKIREPLADNKIQKQINFDDKLDNSQKKVGESNTRLQEQIDIQSPEKVEPIQKPYYVSNQISKLQYNAKDKQTTPSTSWQKCNKYDSSLTCSICSHKRCYLETSCGHFFHITCMMEATKLNPGCPKCHKEITLSAKLYCSGCGQKRMDTSLMIAKDINKKEMQCDQCKKIPK